MTRSTARPGRGDTPRSHGLPQLKARSSGSACDGPPSTVWLLITRRAMWTRFLSDRAWGFHRQSLHRATELREGDIGLVYLTKEAARLPNGVTAILRISGPGRLAPGGQASDFYFYKVPFEPLLSLPSILEFSALAPRLEFVKRRERYGVFLQGKSAIRLDEGDRREVMREVGRVVTPTQRRDLARRFHLEVEADHTP